jgi:hypothetical protein
MNQNWIDGKTVAVLLGGTSAERAISLESGKNVARALEQAGAHVLPIDPALAGWMTQLNEVSFAFNLLHGPGGEDGTIQGLLDLMRLPYSGSGVLGSALSMDKIRTKILWQGAGFPTPDFRVLEAGCDWDAVIADLGTVFVKPSLEGSSLGDGKGKALVGIYRLRISMLRPMVPKCWLSSSSRAPSTRFQFWETAPYPVFVLKSPEIFMTLTRSTVLMRRNSSALPVYMITTKRR